MTFAIHFDPDDYGLENSPINGHRVAGQTFLRAAALAAAGGMLNCYTPRRAWAEVFTNFVSSVDPRISVRWVRPERPQALKDLGTLFVSTPGIGEEAYRRLRSGPNTWSIVGVTHTLFTYRALEVIVESLGAPMFPWDAIICTSNVARAAVRRAFGSQAEYLRWRLGAGAVVEPQLPVIPLGVHCDDFVHAETERMAARRDLGIGEGEVAALFAGRLTLHSKAHPHAMFVGLETTARDTGARLVLLLAGEFSNEITKQRHFEGIERFCPSVTVRWVPGSDLAAYRSAWRAADFFISLADNFQETFGLTPVEAMAAGLPVVATDWDGYKDTIRDGVTGVRIPTGMPHRNAGDDIAVGYETGLYSYDRYVGVASQYVSLEQPALRERLRQVVLDRDLRRRMGEAGRKLAREEYDWPVIMRRYRSLFDDLRRIRSERGREAGGAIARPTRPNPFEQFAEFATHLLTPATRVVLVAADIEDRLAPMLDDPLFVSLSPMIVRGQPDRLRDIAGILRDAGEITIEDLARQAKNDRTVLLVAYMAKLGLVRFRAPPSERLPARAAAA